MNLRVTETVSRASSRYLSCDVVQFLSVTGLGFVLCVLILTGEGVGLIHLMVSFMYFLCVFFLLVFVGLVTSASAVLRLVSQVAKNMSKV